MSMRILNRSPQFSESCVDNAHLVGKPEPPWMSQGQESPSITKTYSPEVLAHCRSLTLKPSPPANFHSRISSDRFQRGTRPTLVTNARVWSGNNDGKDVLDCADILVDQGLFKWIRECGASVPVTQHYGKDIVTLDAKGAWLAPGIVDLHSHIAVEASPGLAGASDGNSLKGSTQPWLRSIDALNTHDDSYASSIAGGVTTSLILPGSANAIGGQAFVIKLRPTNEKSPTSMLLEPPFSLNGSAIDHSTPRWRHMKHACGENPSRVYGQTRMDTFSQFRQAYETARLIKERQDSFCESALKGVWTGDGVFPDDLQWEALVDVLRGRVKVQTHCYEAVDLDDFVRLSNEFKFSVAAFHHAHETYLVPDVLKHAYGDVPPASAMFASFSRYKRESFRHSEFAPTILHDNGLRVVMKSDHPAIVSRFLLHEAQQAHYYGLPGNVALKSVISTPAEVMGLDHRIGYIREGYDADFVLWDSHPLQIGATPTQVFIDGIPQLTNPHQIKKPSFLQEVPRTPDFERELLQTLEWQGLPPLAPQTTMSGDGSRVIFTNVGSMWTRGTEGILSIFDANNEEEAFKTVLVRDGEVKCVGTYHSCSGLQDSKGKPTIVDLAGGSISPGLVSYGTNLGLQEIAMEESTTDGPVPDPLFGDLPDMLSNKGFLVRAVDGLQFSTRDELLAYRGGVTSAITPPLQYGFFGGLSVYFSTGVGHRLAKGAIIQDVAAMHIAVEKMGQPSVSTQIAALRKLLLDEQPGELGNYITRIRNGTLPLVVNVHSADSMASLIDLKGVIEHSLATAMQWTFAGATEAHILAKEIADAGVGVILNPVRPHPYTWDSRRIYPGLPLTQDSGVVHLLRHNVTVGMGVMGISQSTAISAWSARNARFDLSWEYINSGGFLTKADALALSSTNTERLLGIRGDANVHSDLVATRDGDLLDFHSKVIAVISERRQSVDLL